MSTPHRVYLDANIFIMMTETTGQVAEMLAELILSQSLQPLFSFVTSELTIAETFVKPLRDKNIGLAAYYKNMLWNRDVADVRRIDRAVLRHAAELRGGYKYLKLPDAIHVSTALRSECILLLSADVRLKDEFSYSPTSQDPQPIVRVCNPEISFLEAMLRGSMA